MSTLEVHLELYTDTVVLFQNLFQKLRKTIMNSTPLELHIHRYRCPNAGPLYMPLWADSLGPGTLGYCVNLGPMLSQLFGCVHELWNYLEKSIWAQHTCMNKNISVLHFYHSFGMFWFTFNLHVICDVSIRFFVRILQSHKTRISAQSNIHWSALLFIGEDYCGLTTTFIHAQ